MEPSPPQRTDMTNKHIELPAQANISTAPAMLNMNDKAMWVIGWNECLAAHEQARVVGEPVAGVERFMLDAHINGADVFAEFVLATDHDRVVHDLETICDPAGLVSENAQLRDTNSGLQAMYRNLADAAPPAPQEAQAANAMNAALVEVAGCFDAAMCEGLLDALAETTDTRLKDLVERRLMYAHAVAAQAAAPVAQPATTEQAEAPSDADPLTPEQEEWVMDLAERHNLGRRVPQIGAMRGVAPDVFYTDASYRTHELFCFAAELLSTKEQS